jgi:hypothetical protein
VLPQRPRFRVRRSRGERAKATACLSENTRTPEGGLTKGLTRIADGFEGALAVVAAHGPQIAQALQGRSKILVPVNGTEASRRAVEIRTITAPPAHPRARRRCLRPFHRATRLPMFSMAAIRSRPLRAAPSPSTAMLGPRATRSRTSPSSLNKPSDEFRSQQNGSASRSPMAKPAGEDDHRRGRLHFGHTGRRGRRDVGHAAFLSRGARSRRHRVQRAHRRGRQPW